MSTQRNDTEPEQRASTDPGLGGGVQVRTDPGLAPPSQPLPLPQVDGLAGFVGVDRDAPTPVPPILRGQALGVGAREQASSPVGEATPVPPETDGLLSGLIASENEAYFNKAKHRAASSGEVAAAYHGAPRAVAPGNPTPPPEPPVLLRRSVEMEAVGAAPEPVPPVRDTIPAARFRPVAPPSAEPTLPEEPRSGIRGSLFAFGLAAVAVGGAGIVLVLWLTGGTSAESLPAVPSAAPVTAAPPPRETRRAPEPSAAIPPPPPTEPTTAPVQAAPEIAPSGSLRPAAAASVRKVTPKSTPAEPPPYTPPPKDDVKRSM